MATWYTKNRYKKEARKQTLATTESKTSVSARFQPSWAQLRSRMELADELQITWVECAGTYDYEAEMASDEEVNNSAAPINAVVEFKQNFAPLQGTRIDAQYIAINRTVQVSTVPTPAARPAHDPMRHLEQMSMGSLFRLASAMV